MSNVHFKVAVLLFAAMIAATLAISGSALAQNQPTPPTQTNVVAPDANIQSQMQKLIDAIKAADHNAFIANGTDEMKAAMTQQVIQGVHDQLNPRLAAGYSTTYLTELKKGPYQVYIWKITFKDGGDDALIQMTILNGKLAGFFIQ